MPMDFDSARAQFPALQEKVFLDAACVSLAPRSATEAIAEFLRITLECPARSSTLHHISMDEMRSRARPAAARLIGAREDEIALVESTTQGLSLAAQAIPLSAGDRVLLSDLEFIEVATPWLQLQERGVAIDLVPNRNGQVRLEDIAERITPRTRVLAISSVQWSNGYRADLASLSVLCREHGVWLVVDAIQQLGAIPIDVSATPVDILLCGGHKWLNAPFGCGFMYIRKDRLTELRPPLAGYLNVEMPGGWGEYFQTPSISPLGNFKFFNDARRYETGGTANYGGAIGLAASLNMILELGPSRIAEHISRLTTHLMASLQGIQVDVVTPPQLEHRSGIVTFSVGSAAENCSLMEQLLDQKILVSVRYTSNVGGVRVSCHFYNNFSDIDCLLNVVESSLARRR
ncbi:MAG: aminotransferase class V-fold PLP-dependent enzyme [Acidipila sp.]|nr:aminotransferase class V-fold PLP-dependent enzyme [Acidipila sp.]